MDVSARSRACPWWMDGATRSPRRLVALTSPEVGLDLSEPMLTFTYPEIDSEARRQYEEALAHLCIGRDLTEGMSHGGSHGIAAAHEWTWKGGR